MKNNLNIFCFLCIILICNLSEAQISTSQVAKKVEKTTTKYDSTKLFLGESVFAYIGQELYLKGMAQSLRKYGYRSFYKNYKKPTSAKPSNIYKCCDSYSSKYDELVGKYFKVIAVHKHPKSEENEEIYGSKFFLELKEKVSGDKVFYLYDSKNSSTFSNFIVVGYFVKLKNANLNREFIVRGRNWIDNNTMKDINTGDSVSFEAGSKWKVVDLTIEEKYFSLSFILENELGERIPMGVDRANGNNWVFDLTEAEKYLKKFGAKDWETIVKGKISVGFTEEMAILSWGEPSKINRSSYQDQWVYSGQYLYFKNGILKSWN